MKSVVSAGLFTLIILSISVTSRAEVLTIAVSKALLKKKNETVPMIVEPLDASRTSDKEYVTLSNWANNAFKICMDTDTPPAGSPVYRFYTYKSPQLADFCTKLTVKQCIDKVHEQQVAFCKQKVQPSNNDKVEKIEIQETLQKLPGTECGSAKNDLKRLNAEKTALETRKKKLEAEIIKVFGELAANDAAINKARQDAERQCDK
jgi:hypothetical protein